MTELGTSLYTKASQIFDGLVASDRKLKRIRARLRDGTSYFEANDYAVRLGELLSQALNQSTDGLAFISEEVAQELLEPLLTQDHNLISVAVEQIQRNMNTANGVGLSPMLPDLDTGRIEGLIRKVASGDTLEATRWVLGEPIINYSMNVVDQGIEKNARATSKIGLKAYIVREAESSGTRTIKRGNKTYKYSIPCDWCRNLAGTYDYSEVSGRGNDVYRKHEGCRCKITYVNGTRRVDTWTHAEWTAEQASESSKIINDKEMEMASRQRTQEVHRAERMESIRTIASKLGYSERSASIWLNANRKYIERNGLDYMIDYQLNEDKKKRKRLLG